MPLTFMDVLVHFCCHKAPICHSAEQQKQYDENSLMVLKKSFKKDWCSSSENSLIVTSSL